VLSYQVEFLFILRNHGSSD